MAMTADTGNIVNAQHNNIMDLMIDSVAATHVCPHWFAPKLQLRQFPQREKHQLRTVTNTQIKVDGYKYVIMRKSKKLPVVIPLYVCDVRAPMLPVTRLAEQGFSIQVNEAPTRTHKRGFEAQLIQKEGFLRAEMIRLLRGSARTVKDTEARQMGMVQYTGTLAPMTLTPTGHAASRRRNAGHWCWNNQGYLVQRHTHSTLFMPSNNFPELLAELAN